MGRASDAEIAEWQRVATELARALRQHLPVDGYCPVCRWPGGKPIPAPCDVTVETRVALRELCGEEL